MVPGPVASPCSWMQLAWSVVGRRDGGGVMFPACHTVLTQRPRESDATDVRVEHPTCRVNAAQPSSNDLDATQTS